MAKLLTLIMVTATVVLLQSCDSPQYYPPGDNMSGLIIYVDTNTITSGGYYAASVYSADSTNPFNRIPLMSDSLALTRRDNVYEALYDMSGIGSGRFYVASTWLRYPRIPNEIPIVLGIHGCDTSRSCTTYKVVYYPNYEGVYRNMVSWTDTTRRLN